MKISSDAKLGRYAVILHPPGLIRSLVGALGFEPRTLRLSGANTAYKAAALPLSYAPKSVQSCRSNVQSLPGRK
jgi:hypothetical protein